MIDQVTQLFTPRKAGCRPDFLNKVRLLRITSQSSFLVASYLVVFLLSGLCWGQSTPTSDTTGANPTNATSNQSTKSETSNTQKTDSASTTTGGSDSRSNSPTEIDPEAALIPDFFIASVAIDAVVVGERINMDATVEVVINRDTGWQRIPLRFDQAHIWSREYSGPGEEAPDLSTESGNDGISWMLKGKGKHLLMFSMWAPYRKSIIGSRLQFTLPALSEQFDTKLNLTVPDSNAVLRASPNLEIQNTIRNADHTIFETSVSKNRVDAIWTVPQSNASLVSKVVTKFHLKPSPDSLLLIADQTIDLQQQDTKELIVKLPSEFPFTTTEVNQSEIQELPDRPGWVKVRFNEAPAGKVELRWEFRKQLSSTGERVVIDGLEIEGANQEAGSIRIDDLNGYRIIPQLSDSRLVYRVGLSEMVASGTGSLNSLYEYLQQPFRLVQEIRPIDPLHSVTTIHEVNLNQETMSLKVHQLIEVERGAVTDFKLNWNQFEKEGWLLKSVAASDLTLGNIQTTVDETGDSIQFQLSDALSSGDRLQLVATFERPLPLDEKSINWTFPKVPAANSRGKLLVLNHEDQLEVNVDQASQSTLSPPLNEHHLHQLAEMWKLSNELKSLLLSPKTHIFKSINNEPFEVNVTEHARTIQVNSTVEVQEATPRDLLIYQRFKLNIQYGRIQSLELVLPTKLEQLIKPADISTGLSVNFEGEPLSVSVIGKIPRVVFPREIIGTHEFEIQYRLPFASDKKNTKVEIPVITLQGVPFSQIACLITPVENVQLLTENSEWIAAQTFPTGPLWIRELNNQSIDTIPVQVGGGLSESAQQYFVEHAHFWTHYEDDGRAKTLARFEIISPPSRLVMSFPLNSEFVASIDGESIPEEAILRTEDDPRQVILNLPDGISDRRIIEFQYLTEGQSPFSFTEQQTFEFPQFGKSVWVNETIWEVQLPNGFHLFEYPELKPLFNWKREGIIWKREPSAPYQAQRRSLIETLPQSFRFEQNFYAFRGFSPVSTVTFRSMNRSLILLIGAGLALSLGFIFYRFPVTRNVFSLVVLAFVFALASVWYLEPLMLLLQPAIIGVILALTATLIDLRTNRSNAEQFNGRSDRTVSSDSHAGSHHNVGDGTTRIYTPVTTSQSDSAAG